MNGIEANDSFSCFGASCSVYVDGATRSRSPAQAVALAKQQLLAAHERFSRFLPDSELSRLNADPRTEVPASGDMLALADAVRIAGAETDGLVDGTLVEEICAAGYEGEVREPLALSDALALAPERRPAQGAHPGRWRDVAACADRGTVARAPGVQIDSGGLVKGLLADALARELAGHASFAVSCAGDLALGGTRGARRPVVVESPFTGAALHTFALAAGGVATSGIGRRAWIAAGGAPAHHLLDPASGRPAYTGVVQATALAGTAVEAEIRAKAAVLSGPAGASRWLRDGGVVVLDDGSHHVIEPPPRIALSELSGFAQRRRTPALQHR